MKIKRRRWTKKEEADVWKQWMAGKTINQIAKKQKRTPSAINARTYILHNKWIKK